MISTAIQNLTSLLPLWSERNREEIIISFHDELKQMDLINIYEKFIPQKKNLQIFQVHMECVQGYNIW